MSRQLQRLVRSQILFREVNERLREVTDPSQGSLEFVCECSAEDCIETMELQIEEYERIRSHANLFLVASGHEVSEVDRVVDQGDGYLLVEKIVAADEVIRADPRRRGI
jgi:intergrase/recombinase